MRSASISSLFLIGRETKNILINLIDNTDPRRKTGGCDDIPQWMIIGIMLNFSKLTNSFYTFWLPMCESIFMASRIIFEEIHMIKLKVDKQ